MYLYMYIEELHYMSYSTHIYNLFDIYIYTITPLDLEKERLFVVTSKLKVRIQNPVFCIEVNLHSRSKMIECDGFLK